MPDPTPSARARIEAARLARIAARRLWRRNLLERAAAGETRQTLADAEQVSLPTIRRALARARAECPLESAGVFLAVQRERIERAVQLAEARIAEGDLAATYALIQLTPLLLDLDGRQRYEAAE